MKNILITIVQVCGIAFIIAFFMALLNYTFGWHLGFKGAEVPADPIAGVVFLVLGIICTVIGRYFGRK